MKRTMAWLLLLLMLVCALPAEADSQLRVTWQGTAVDLKTIGSWQTVIRTGGRDVTVPSSELAWESTTDVRFAYVYAPKAGKVNMRMSGRSKASIITKIPTGRIVIVFEKNDTWSGILYDGLIGYVQNSTLRFIEAPDTPRATATLSYKGKTDVKTKVTMRSGANQGSRAVIGLRPGMAVTVFEKGKTWSEVEVNGYHGYVLTEHLAEIREAEAMPEEPEDSDFLPPPPDDGIPLVEEEVDLD